MFRFEKVFQNDDKFFIKSVLILKTILILITIYLFSIFESNSIYEIFNYKIFQESELYNLSKYLILIYIIGYNFIFNNQKYYINNLKQNVIEIIFFIIAFILILLIFKIFKIKLISIKQIFLLIPFFLFVLVLTNLFANWFYKYLIRQNVIQRNIMLVGNYNYVYKIINEAKNEINIYKCCLILDLEKQNIKEIRNYLKIPIFNKKDDIRTILEYHFLGQIWVLKDISINLKEIINRLLKFSVDLIIVDVEKINKDKSQRSLINSKYEFTAYEISRFHGINLFFKILIDKILSIFFLIFAIPIITFFSILIYFEDGFPILFTQDRTGWDGRRFKIYKLRSLFNKKYDPVLQVTSDDQRKLKVGKIIRKFSIDEMPQLFNVLKGDMSLVGPRPHPVSLDLEYANSFDMFLTRYRSNPGLTGWSQVNGYRGATQNPEQMKKRMELDIWYLKNWTLSLDLLIILKSFYAIFKFKGD